MSMAESKDSSRKLDTLDRLITCAICNEIFTEPKGLPCLHIFCLKCIQSWFKSRQSERIQFLCPTCREPTNLPKGDVAELPTSFQTNSLIEFYNNLMLDKKQHELKDAESQIKRSSDLNRQLCMTALDEIDWYLQETVNKIDNTANEVHGYASDQMESIKMFIRAKLEQLETIPKRFETVHNPTCECIQRILELISCHCEQAVDIDIKQLRRDVQQMLDACKSDIEGTASTSFGQARNSFQQTEPNLEVLNSSQIGETDKNTASGNGQMQGNIAESSQRLSEINAEELKVVNVLKTEKTSQPRALALNDRLEIVVIGFNERNQLGITLYNAGGIYLKEVSEESGEGGLEDPKGVAFSHDDRILISENTNDHACIKEYHIDDGFLRIVHKQTGMSFGGMCASEQGIACLSYNLKSKETSIMLFSKETANHLKDIELHAPAIKTLPLYLTYASTNYFITFGQLHSVYVFDENGGLMYTIGKAGNQPGQFGILQGLAAFGADKLLVCSFNDQRVQLFNQKGRYIRSFVQMKCAKDIFVTLSGSVFVLESFSKRIQVFTLGLK